MAITSVGVRPRQREVSPSLRAIFRRPSSVDVIVLRRVSSTAQSVVERGERCEMLEVAGDAMQNWALLFTQNTSLQHAVTPRFGGRFEKEAGEGDADLEAAAAARMPDEVEELGWDWSRTRTTSRGVTIQPLVYIHGLLDGPSD